MLSNAYFVFKPSKEISEAKQDRLISLLKLLELFKSSKN